MMSRPNESIYKGWYKSALNAAKMWLERQLVRRGAAAAIEDAAVDQQSCVLFSTAVHLLQWRNRRRRSRQAELCSISLKRSSHFLLRRSFLLRCSAVEEERRNRKGISSSIAAHFSNAALRSRGGVPQFERFYTLPIYNASKTNKKYLQFL